MRTVKVFEEAWPLHTPFVIARGSRSEARVVVVELEEEGVKGTGECTPYPRYGESDALGNGANYERRAGLKKGSTRGGVAKILPPAQHVMPWIVHCGIWRRENSSNRWLI